MQKQVPSFNDDDDDDDCQIVSTCKAAVGEIIKRWKVIGREFLVSWC